MSLDRLTKQRMRMTAHFSLVPRLASFNWALNRAINRCGFDATPEEVDRAHRELTRSKEKPFGESIEQWRDSVRGGLNAPSRAWVA